MLQHPFLRIASTGNSRFRHVRGRVSRVPGMGSRVSRSRRGLRSGRGTKPQVHVAGQFLGPPPGPLREVAFGQGLHPPGAAAEQPLAVAAAGRLAEELAVLFPQLPGGHPVQGCQLPERVVRHCHLGVLSLKAVNRHAH